MDKRDDEQGGAWKQLLFAAGVIGFIIYMIVRIKMIVTDGIAGFDRIYFVLTILTWIGVLVILWKNKNGTLK